MKKSNVTALLLVLMLSHTAWSAECENTEGQNQIDTRVYDKETIKQALMVLLQSRALTVRPAKGLKINKDLVEELRREGVIQTVPMKEGVICVDPVAAIPSEK
ncbi:MAG: hypothetical protein AB7K41_04805 [Bdellovibrionales bacterium]